MVQSEVFTVYAGKVLGDFASDIPLSILMIPLGLDYGRNLQSRFWNRLPQHLAVNLGNEAANLVDCVTQPASLGLLRR